jgi:hypothetical protein
MIWNGKSPDAGARARYVVTFNEKHFAAAGRFGIHVVTPKAFLDIIGA